ncbi:class I SAM-dependent methyltransferase [Actinospica sp. MGRD01-02]|uniref:Class I SAM-dependent methyltransferase n=1 Tax=Actinospica acidithermotolerans TaxID=2828514 RepID=A0A941E7J5_9ACTN|nr:class I SAM-dependent methyltransferase [Actinospica acidithermotolerans]MBR7827795.1 class I SAM-dependent methyltransferase [Actinospica acidithermotolerans]
MNTDLNGSDSIAPQHFGLPSDYRQRARPEYFDDVDDGVTWQPDVYPYAADLARQQGRNSIIDIGCGRAAKLAALAEVEPTWNFTGVDFGPNIQWCSANHTFGRWIEADLETQQELAIPADQLARSVIVCCDVLEHLVRPDNALALMAAMARAGGCQIVLSTPAREHRAGAGYIGEPRNPAHIREWTSREFATFLAMQSFEILDHQLTRSDDGGGGLTTQLVTVIPSGW